MFTTLTTSDGTLNILV